MDNLWIKYFVELIHKLSTDYPQGYPQLTTQNN